MKYTVVRKLKVTPTKGIKIIKVWVKESWQYKVKKYSIMLFVFWVRGWDEEVGTSSSGIPMTDVEYFDSLEEAEKYANKIKANFLKG